MKGGAEGRLVGALQTQGTTGVLHDFSFLYIQGLVLEKPAAGKPTPQEKPAFSSQKKGKGRYKKATAFLALTAPLQKKSRVKSTPLCTMRSQSSL